ncbi:DEAD/DEAH box helicase [Tundrisphaera lichenicola]|uniref:DEAD/DEAH box helicase n=1 Tax=Tundrisphaera lichenicola TaxID=2029860 RepID=UPI003EC0C05B
MQTTTEVTEPTIHENETITFAGMGLSEVTLRALDRAGFKDPSPIQSKLVPAALAGRDCLGNAPTGTGKTAAFLLPILEKIDERERRPQALILAPTRELVTQIGREFERLCFGRRAYAVAVVGGESIVRQQRMLGQGCQVVVATPGRLMDLMGRNAIRLDKVKIVVLDEADQMLDIGFRPAVEEILRAIPDGRQTLLLSATMPKEVRELANTYLTDPEDVRLIHENEDATIPAIRQSYLMVAADRKFDLLIGLIRREEPPRAIIFCRTKRGADRVGMLLRQEGFRADTMHGNLSQAQRNRVLQGFRLGRLSLLVATDVVGRGIDVRGVTHVINFDLPEDPEHYVHRIGRTGRMGSDGAAFSLVCPDQAKMLDQIERAITRELEADTVDGIPAPPRPFFRPQRPAPGGRRGPARGGRPFHPPRRNGGGHGGGHGGGGGNFGGGPRGRRDRTPTGAGR